MGNESISPNRSPSQGLENESISRLESSAANTQECIGRSTGGLQTVTEAQAITKAPAIVASPVIQWSGQDLQPQALPPPTDPQHPAAGNFGFQGPQSFSQAGLSSHIAQIQAQGPGGAFSMVDMSRAMHEHNLWMSTGQQYGQPHQQRFPAGPLNASTAPALVYQMHPEMPQLAGHAASSYQNNRSWPIGYPQHYQALSQQNPHNAIGPGYPQFMQPHQVQPPSINPVPSQYPNIQWPPQQEHPQQPPNSYAYFASSYTSSTLSGHGVCSYSAPPYPASYLRRSSLPAHQSSASRPDGEYEGIYPNGGITSGSGYSTNNPKTRSGSVPDIGSQISSSSSNFTSPTLGPLYSTLLRGPPRKPKQSGHALWVGNLPAGASVVHVKDHFSRDATADIESVFLISKSNCAFVNYKTEAACASAVARFHDSRFQGVRLVCRLRRGSATPPVSTPSGPTSSAKGISSENSPRPPAAHGNDAQEERGEAVADIVPREEPERPKDRYFIVKSLTVEDLDISVQNGTWATQSHNEEALNSAFESSESVYLIFSANKSGEYHGYARMVSPISGESSPLATDWTSRTPAAEGSDLPKSIPTPATEHAPKGRIIDDSARGTIFWEADGEAQGSSTPRDGKDNSSEKSDDGEDGMTTTRSWGKPFKIEWISTTRLPFYRTRGLRNSWNANREVKIARDGTELETSVGRRLVRMFHHSVTSPAGTSVATAPIPQGPLEHHHVRQL
ncbi:hypothetical protein GP486_004516 [Trichoglossum hirsutum]|uniref:YTH domain-containing protein n=1 Tax=Trichoglossum hirsutum TaxID=265104 RepID=A0A9P8LAQ3_9PEZI|nr:hypothetical protein GP486_004516 [Trichoglossum hirsutum]